MKQTTILAAFAALVLAPAASDAQAAATQRITLDDALRIAEGSNPAYRRALNDTDLNGVEMRTVWFEQLLPTARLSVMTGYNGNLQPNAFDDFGNPRENPDTEWNYFSQSAQSISLSWNITGMSLLQSHRRQSLANEGRELAQVRALTDVQADVRNLYMDALEQLELLESESELLDARRIDLDVAERLFRLGSKTRVDVLNAELEVEQQSLALQQQDAAYQTALLELTSALGTDEQRTVELVPIELPLFDPAGVDAGVLARRALDTNPTLAESEVAVETARHNVAEQNNLWWPQLSFGFNAFKQAYLPGREALFGSGDLGSTFNIQLSVPFLSNYFSTRQSQQQATIDLRNQIESEREARMTLEKDVRQAVLTLNSQWESLQVLERSAEIAGEALRLGREQYRLGQLEFEGLRGIVDQEAAARRQVITARHAFVEALLTLERAVGGPVRPASAAPSPQAPAGN